MLTGDFAHQFVNAIRQEMRIPERLSLLGDQDDVAQFQPYGATPTTCQLSLS